MTSHFQSTGCSFNRVFGLASLTGIIIRYGLPVFFQEARKERLGAREKVTSSSL